MINKHKRRDEAEQVEKNTKCSPFLIKYNMIDLENEFVAFLLKNGHCFSSVKTCNIRSGIATDTDGSFDCSRALENTMHYSKRNCIGCH